MMKPGKVCGTAIVCCVVLLSAFSGLIGQEKSRWKEETKLTVNTKEIEKEEEKVFVETGKELPPRVAITFDDGPHPVCTPMLLEGLRKRGVKATFFLVGKNIPGQEELVRQMEADGHLIGNHTFSHVKLTDLRTEDAGQELLVTSNLIEQITGKSVEYIRPPFGEWERKMESGIELFPVFWDVDTKDWLTRNVSEIVRAGTEKIRDGNVILMHDCYETSVEAAFEIIDRLEKEGFEFVTVDQLILE